MIDVMVANRKDQAERIVSFELVSQSDLPSFEAGSHSDIEIAPGLLRQYSIANSPEERHRYLIGVLREQNSRGGSERIHAEFLQGVRTRISRPEIIFASMKTPRILFLSRAESASHHCSQWHIGCIG